MKLTAPFPYFGGKSAIAAKVWRALGRPAHYIEPFYGSGAVLLARPGWKQGMTETVCDKDGFVANAWRGLQFAPDEVARWCDWPVNHADLSARKKRLIENEARLLENLIADDEWFDAKLAGYWIWAASCWIGAGLTRIGAIPCVDSGGAGVHKLGNRPHVSYGGMGVHKLGNRPHVSYGGTGVHKTTERPHDPNLAADVREPYNVNLYDWFRALSERLRYVRVVCGDWTRVCGGNWQDNQGTAGIFFDPPYAVADRDAVYHVEDFNIADAVREWATERGKKRSHRIVIAGYDEHADLVEKHGWRSESWTARGGYGNQGNNTRGQENRRRETIYYSPHCLAGQHTLFA